MGYRVTVAVLRGWTTFTLLTAGTGLIPVVANLAVAAERTAYSRLAVALPGDTVACPSTTSLASTRCTALGNSGVAIEAWCAVLALKASGIVQAIAALSSHLVTVLKDQVRVRVSTAVTLPTGAAHQ